MQNGVGLPHIIVCGSGMGVGPEAPVRDGSGTSKSEFGSGMGAGLDCVGRDGSGTENLISISLTTNI